MIKERIKRIAEAQNVSFSDLCIMIDVKRTTLLYHLSNPNIPLKLLTKIAKALDVEVTELMTDEEEVDIKGKVKLKKKNYNLSNMNEFAKFIDDLAMECGLESDLYYTQKKEIE